MTDDSTEHLPPGTMFGRYRVVRRLGAGAMGAVYEAEHTGLKKRVAMKTLLPAIAKNPEAVARFLREGEASARIRHPHVVEVFDVGTHEQTPFLVMEFLEGQDLGKLLAREHALPIARVVEIMLPVAAAVASAHEEGVVHRDLKPENIFLARVKDGGIQPKVVDFGISKIADDDSGLALTATNALMGTPYYMSPEQASGGKGVDARSDQYALGVILYECVTGVRPFDGPNLFGLLNAINSASVRLPRGIRPDLPEAFERIIMRAMDRVPSQRYPSVRALAADLLPFGNERTRARWQSDSLMSTGSAGSFPAVAAPSMPGVPGTLANAGTEISATANRTITDTKRPRGAMFAGIAALLIFGIGGAIAVSRRGATPPDAVRHPATNVVPTTELSSTPTPLPPAPMATPPDASAPYAEPIIVPPHGIRAPERSASRATRPSPHPAGRRTAERQPTANSAPAPAQHVLPNHGHVEE